MTDLEQKRPLGIMPQWAWRRGRIDDLTATLLRYAKYDEGGGTLDASDYQYIRRWANEVAEHQEWLEAEKKEMESYKTANTHQPATDEQLTAIERRAKVGLRILRGDGSLRNFNASFSPEPDDAQKIIGKICSENVPALVAEVRSLREKLSDSESVRILSDQNREWWKKKYFELEDEKQKYEND